MTGLPKVGLSLQYKYTIEYNSRFGNQAADFIFCFAKEKNTDINEADRGEPAMASFSKSNESDFESIIEDVARYINDEPVQETKQKATRSVMFLPKTFKSETRTLGFKNICATQPASEDSQHAAWGN